MRPPPLKCLRNIWMVPMETEVDMEVEAGGVHDNGLLWESKKEKGKVIHIQHLVIYNFNTFINIGQQKEKINIAFAKGETYKWS